MACWRSLSPPLGGKLRIFKDLVWWETGDKELHRLLTSAGPDVWFHVSDLKDRGFREHEGANPRLTLHYRTRPYLNLRRAKQTP